MQEKCLSYRGQERPKILKSYLAGNLTPYRDIQELTDVEKEMENITDCIKDSEIQ